MFRQKFQLITSIIGTIALLLLALYGLMGLLSTSAWAQQALSSEGSAASLWGGSTVPLVMNYQGHVEDSEGNPLTGYYTMTIRIYDDVIATTALWEEEHQSVTVREGYFDVLLGNTTPISDTLFNEPDRFIGVTVHPHDEMVPRQRFASVPYTIHSFHATEADQADRAYGLNAPDGEDAVIVDDEGKVGIGTTSPSRSLDVHGEVGLNSGDGGQNWLHFSVYNDGENPSIIFDDENYLTFGTWDQYNDPSASSEKVRILGNGDVGIGTTTPEATLDVNGKIKMRSETSNSDSADTVVTKGYADSRLLQCTNASSGGRQVNCPSSYIMTGCGTYRSSEDVIPNGNGCYNDESGVWARCCRVSP